MRDCIFCSIAEKHTPSYSFYEDDLTMAFLDYQPSVEGHSIVLLKKHGESMLDYSPAEIGAVWNTVRTVMVPLEKAFHTNIFTIGTNHNEPAGIHHMHIHILPRYPSDNGGIIQSIVRGRVIDDLSIVLRRIKEYIK